MKTALFSNFTTEEFIGYWDGKPKKFAPGQSIYMPDYLARHFAKHLVNRELLRPGAYKDGEKMTSPKKPEEVPLFMELFNKAYTPDNTEELGEIKDDVNSLIDSANKNRQSIKSAVQDPTQPQIIMSPDFDESEDDESSFGDKPKE